MTEQEYLDLCKSYYPAILKLKEVKDFYEYEKQYCGIIQTLNRAVFESSISHPPADRRKKKTLCVYGEIAVSNSHPFSNRINGFGISPLMQEKMTYAGQLDCYHQCNEILSMYLNVEVNAMQVHRVTDTYGKLLEEQAMTEQAGEDIIDVKKGESVYAMVDGSMLLTREKSWSEVKLGRIFKSSDNIELSEDRGWIRHSMYDAYLGSCKTFTRRFELKLDSYESLNENLIFITDGAPWIKNWIQDAYPKATQVLDYYHACEHLCAFAKEYFKDEKEKSDWIEHQKTLLFESQVVQVIANIKSLQTKQRKTKKMKTDLLQYYEGNKDRMDYKRYQTMGAGLTGSGAIESAHRTVIQKRMKQAGQRWSQKRAQNMLTLRCTRLSGNWKKVVQLICSKEAIAA